MTVRAPLSYATPLPARQPISVTCCVAFTWAVVTSPIVTWPLAGYLAGWNDVDAFVFHHPWVTVAWFVGLPLVGLFLSIKGVTDIDRRHDARGRWVGMLGVWIGALGAVIGAVFVKG